MRSLPVVLLLGSLSLAADTHAGRQLGKPFTLDRAMSVDALVSAPASHLNRTVQVKGKVAEVCERMGCWMNLVDAATSARIRIKVVDGEITFPKSSVGKMAVAEGTLTKTELTREQAIGFAKHQAEEQGRQFDPSMVKSGVTLYQIQGSGAVVLD